MILLEDPHPRDDAHWLTAIFGVGLLGSGVATALRSAHRSLETATCALAWRDAELQRVHLMAIEALIHQRVRAAVKARKRVSIRLLWSAGDAGFSATEPELAGEGRSFEAVLTTAQSLAAGLPEADVAFWLLSSAGGLFEGQRLVDGTSGPQPLRPYGRLKRWQEELLLATPDPLRPRVVRISSVFGRVDPRHRMGLIPTLIDEGLRRDVSIIHGSPSTLRDFIWVDDVARYLAGELLGSRFGPPPTVSYLCSGRPTALGEVLCHVETVLGRRLAVRFSAEPTNAADITFSPRLRPADWSTTDLPLAIAQVHRHALAGGFRS